MAANGPLDISLPVERDETLPYRQIRLNYDTAWPRQHLRALLSAYNSTPFYEFFADDFERLYSQQHTLLWDFNVDLMHLIASLLDVEVNYSLTESFAPSPEGFDDLRIAIEPRFAHLLRGSCDVPYYQVFAAKFGFVPNLSILDLLFNLGPESIFTLRQMAQQVV